MGVETRNLKIEKLAYVLLMARKFHHYFQAHHIAVWTDQPLKQILQRPDTLERLLKWSIELNEFYIDYRPRLAIKGRALVDFVTEFTYDIALEPEKGIPEAETLEQPNSDEDLARWKLFVDESSNQHGCGSRLILQTPLGELMEYAIRIQNHQQRSQG